MGLSKTIWTNPAEFLRVQDPADPVLLFAPSVLQATARRFIDGFPGLVTYAVKSNPDEMVVQNLSAAGVRGFDVASPYEIRMIRRLAPDAALHYNNPVRSRAEIAVAVAHGVKSYSVDSHSELAKLAAQVPAAGCEISVRFKLPSNGSAYNFGAKFGATAEMAVGLLRDVVALGFTPSLTFHPGTQMSDLMLWDEYIRKAAWIAAEAGVTIARLNTGGGFPSHRMRANQPPLEEIFAIIDRATAEAFGDRRPALVCEPGRGMVGDAFAVVCRVKAVRDDSHVFLNDGYYGSLNELCLIGMIDRIDVIAPNGVKRSGTPAPRVVFGPTCDSTDRLPGEVMLPSDIAEEDFVLIQGMGAYSTVTNTAFNGFGNLTIATVLSLRG